MEEFCRTVDYVDELQNTIETQEAKIKSLETHHTTHMNEVTQANEQEQKNKEQSVQRLQLKMAAMGQGTFSQLLSQ